MALYSAKLAVTDYRHVIRELNKIEPALVKGFKKDFREIAQPIRDNIRSTIPSQPPLSGFRRVRSATGLTWNNRRNARTVLVKMRAPKADSKKGFGVVSLRIVSAATIIADMSGRGSSSIDGQMTPEYEYHIKGVQTTRRHRVNGQGRAMIRVLGQSPSRYIYPAAEEKMDEARDKLADVVGDAMETIERNINGR